MADRANSPSSSDAYHDILHRKMLIYGFTLSIIGLPVGLLLSMPVVWGLAVAGVVVGGVKLWVRRNQNQQVSPNQQVHRTP
jgi:hypothetical protein